MRKVGELLVHVHTVLSGKAIEYVGSLYFTMPNYCFVLHTDTFEHVDDALAVLRVAARILLDSINDGDRTIPTVILGIDSLVVIKKPSSSEYRTIKTKLITT